MFAAGEIMAGNVLGRGYAAGIGMTIGSVFGRVAGREAAAMHATETLERSRPADDGLQLLPLLRGAVRGLPGDGDAPRRSRTATSTTSPISATAAAPATSTASSRRRTSSTSTCPKTLAQVARASPTPPMPGRAPSPACSRATACRSPRRGAERRGLHPRLRGLARPGGAVRQSIRARAPSTS